MVCKKIQKFIKKRSKKSTQPAPYLQPESEGKQEHVKEPTEEGERESGLRLEPGEEERSDIQPPQREKEQNDALQMPEEEQKSDLQPEQDIEQQANLPPAQEEDEHSLQLEKPSEHKVPDLWQRAYESLDPKKKELIERIPMPKSDTNHFPDSDCNDHSVSKRLEVLNGVVDSVKKQYEIGKENSKLRKPAQKILAAVLSFKDIIGAAVAFDTTGHVSHAWAIVSLGLTITQNYHTRKMDWFQSSAYVADVLARYSIVEKLYCDRNPMTDPYVENAITRVYSAVLNYSAEVMSYYENNIGTRALKSITAPSLPDIKKSVEDEESCLEKWLQIYRELQKKEATKKMEQKAEEILAEIDELKISIQKVDNNLEFRQLKIAEEAFYNAYTDQDYEECLQGTRAELLSDILVWADGQEAKPTFWLNGMAGTGKSTISRTVARILDEEGLLGGSFFFKRGGKDRENAKRLFPTVIKQMVDRVPSLKLHVKNAMEKNSSLKDMNIKDQFNGLFFQPLKDLDVELETPLVLAVVIDALDECQIERDITDFVSLLPKMQQFTAIRLRFFVTSRPEMPILDSFRLVENDQFILHNIERPIIHRDILFFLRYKFGEMRKNHPRLQKETDDWPGEDIIQKLVDWAVPLFIFAATICRFVGSRNQIPKKRLNAIISSQENRKHKGIDQEHLQLASVYWPVLQNLIPDKGSNERSGYESEYLQDFRHIVGSIVLLYSPLSQKSLADLLCIDEEEIEIKLEPLGSVLFIPDQDDIPVRLLHLSFREFLVDDSKCANEFWVDEKEGHKRLALHCLNVMTKDTCGLKRNICNLKDVGIFTTEIDSGVIQDSISAVLQYSCRYWTHHLQNGNLMDFDWGHVDRFLREHLLHWLEAMSILGWFSETIECVTTLESLAKNNGNERISEFLYDVRRFVLRHKEVIETAPLHVYSSALLFSPKRSIVRTIFDNQIPKSIKLPDMEDDWGPLLQTLEGHSDRATSIAISPDGKVLASGSQDKTIRLWELHTGRHLDTLEGHTSWVNEVSFSYDGRLLASGSDDRTIRIWATKTGMLKKTLIGHSHSVGSVAFSPQQKSLLLASASFDRNIILWDIATDSKEPIRILDGHVGSINSVAFSKDGQQLVSSGSHDKTVRLWSTQTGDEQRVFTGHTQPVSTVAISPNNQLIASGSIKNTVRIWDKSTGKVLKILQQPGCVNSVSFSPNSLKLASCSSGRNIRIWDVNSDKAPQTLDCNGSMVSSITFSDDSRLLASASSDAIIRLWDTTLDKPPESKYHSDGIRRLVVSPNGRFLATGSWDKTVKLWDAKSGDLLKTFTGYSWPVCEVEFSLDGKWLASTGWKYSIRLSDIESGASSAIVLPTGGVNSTRLEFLKFSTDGRWLACGYEDKVMIWDTKSAFISNAEPRILIGHSERISTLAFSPTGRLLASGSSDSTIILWDVSSNKVKLIHEMRGQYDIRILALSPDDQQLASYEFGQIITLWNTQSGEQTKQIELIELNEYLQLLRYSADGTWLETERGRIDVEIPEIPGSRYCSGTSFDTSNYAAIQKPWVVFNGQRILYLPPDLRPARSAIHEGSLSIGALNGWAYCMGFDYDLLRRETAAME